MVRCRWTRWVLGMAVAAGPMVHAQTPPAANYWQQPDSHRASVGRNFQSDGTPPAVSKGPKPKAALATPVAVPVTRIELPAVSQPRVDLQPITHASPIDRVMNLPAPLPLPRMPHGYLDPTHPAGPAEPGSASSGPAPSPRVGPVTSGYARALPR